MGNISIVIGDGVFDENGELNEGYEMNCNPDYPEDEEHDLWWCIWNNDNDKYYDEIYLRIKELFHHSGVFFVYLFSFLPPAGF